MAHSIRSGNSGLKGLTGRIATGLAAVLFGLTSFASLPSAGGLKDGEIERPWYAVTEFRAGGFFHSIETTAEQGEGGGAVNLEVLFGRIGPQYENRVLDAFFKPRVHVGTMINLEGNTSNYYAGLTWQWNLTDWAFLEGSFGGAVHDGPNDHPTKASYGCTLNFRESGSIGFSLSDEWNLLFTVDHMSNGGLCDKNKGLTNAGVRLGYKW